MDINPEKCNLKYFIGLVKVKQQPFEDDLTAKLQAKIDWLKRVSAYDLTQRQKDAMQKDVEMIKSVEAYVSIQHQIIAHLFQRLELTETECAAHLADKLTAEQSLRTYIYDQHKGEIQPTA